MHFSFIAGICRGSVNGRGRSYIGNLSVTVTGKTCQFWSSQTPHNHET